MTFLAKPFEVLLDVEQGALIARIEPPALPDGAEVAFYLLRNGQRVETRWYAADPCVRFSTAPDASRFKAVGFVRARSDQPAAMATSAPVQRSAPGRAPSRIDTLPVASCDVDGLRAALRDADLQRFDVALPDSPFVFSGLLQRHNAPRLFVVLGGAVPDRRTLTLPRFSRYSWAADFPGALLCIADPTLGLDPEIRLGWYFGNAAHDATAALARVVLAFADALGVTREGITTYGSSGGGFAAMQLAARIGDGATAIAINAQTDALLFGIDASVEKFLDVCTGGMTREAAWAGFPARLRLVDAWRAPSASHARALLVQNRRDAHHRDAHFSPFAASFGVPEAGGTSADGRIGALLYDFPNGHGAEPRSMLPAILARASALRTPNRTPVTAPWTSSITSSRLSPVPVPSSTRASRLATAASTPPLARRPTKPSGTTWTGSTSSSRTLVYPCTRVTPQARESAHRIPASESPVASASLATVTDKCQHQSNPSRIPMSFIDKVSTIKPKADFVSLTYISLRNRYVYLAVGKAANSTVKHHLYELEYAGTRFKPRSVHDRQSAPLLSPFQLPDDMLEEVFTSPKYYRFSIVRNPYTRLLSCYLDRIVPQSGAAYRQLVRALGRPEGASVSFPEFIRTACAQEPFAQNNHWRLQVAEICAAAIPYDFVGKQENFAEDMGKIWARIAPDRPAPEFARANKSPSITGASSRLHEYYTPELVELVRSAYRHDFEHFGYSTDLD